MIDKAVKDKYERIANMLLAQVAETQIALAVNCSPARLSQIKESEEFKLVLSECAGSFFEKQRDLNEAWDEIETTALTNVLQMLNYNKDPEYLIRVAAMANRAQRRGVAPVNKPLDASNAVGRPVVINLNQTFVARLQNLSVVDGGLADENPISDDVKKHVDLLPPARVEQILDVRAPGVTKKQAALMEIDDLMDEGFEIREAGGGRLE
jgi:hypothetical protein